MPEEYRGKPITAPESDHPLLSGRSDHTFWRWGNPFERQFRKEYGLQLYSKKMGRLSTGGGLDEDLRTLSDIDSFLV